jgi:hypothetical protein
MADQPNQTTLRDMVTDDASERSQQVVYDHFPARVGSLCFGFARQNADMATKQLIAEGDQLS